MHLKFSYKCMSIFVNMYRNVTKSFPEISVYYKNALTAFKKKKRFFLSKLRFNYYWVWLIDETRDTVRLFSVGVLITCFQILTKLPRIWSQYISIGIYIKSSSIQDHSQPCSSICSEVAKIQSRMVKILMKE